MRLKLALAASTLAVMFAAPAFADIVFTQGNVPGSLDTVLLDGGALDTNVTGTVGSNNTAVLFTGTETYAGGTDRYVGVSGSTALTGSASFATNLGQYTIDGTINVP